VKVRADIVFTRVRLAIFVDGCFWHGCPQHGLTPKSNCDYWIPKLAGNRKRDELVGVALKAEGWAVLRFWEHVPADGIVTSVIDFLDGQPLRAFEDLFL